MLSVLDMMLMCVLCMTVYEKNKYTFVNTYLHYILNINNSFTHSTIRSNAKIQKILIYCCNVFELLI